jgi:nitrogen fixation protein NifZ
MKAAYDYGDEVRVIRNVRNDGTYPGKEVGEFLLRRGSVGYVQNVGTYLQEYTIYSVHFVEEDLLIGCKEEELVPASDPWVPSLYEFRDKVTTTKPLSIKGEVIVEAGAPGEVLKVLRDVGPVVQYHVRFPGRTLQVPESVLTPLTVSREEERKLKQKQKDMDEEG